MQALARTRIEPCVRPSHSQRHYRRHAGQTQSLCDFRHGTTPWWSALAGVRPQCRLDSATRLLARCNVTGLHRHGSAGALLIRKKPSEYCDPRCVVATGFHADAYRIMRTLAGWLSSVCQQPGTARPAQRAPCANRTGLCGLVRGTGRTHLVQLPRPHLGALQSPRFGGSRGKPEPVVIHFGVGRPDGGGSTDRNPAPTPHTRATVADNGSSHHPLVAKWFATALLRFAAHPPRRAYSGGRLVVPWKPRAAECNQYKRGWPLNTRLREVKIRLYATFAGCSDVALLTSRDNSNTDA